jgi:hypothetical protein
VVQYPWALDAAVAAAQTVGLLSDLTTGTTPVPVLDKLGDENGMHAIPPLDVIRPPGQRDLRLCMHNASECQDAVTTRQDHGQTCQDVFAEVNSSLYVPLVSLRGDGSGGQPLVLVRTGRPVAVVLDVESYEEAEVAVAVGTEH